MLMKGKKGIVFGVANQRSIAWGIARSIIDQGGEVVFSYLNERMKPGVEKLTAEIPNVKLYECDVANQDSIDTCLADVTKDLGSIDFMVHSIAFADKTDLEGDFVDTSREGFKMAHEISAYSLVALSKAFMPIMNENGSILTLTYLGAAQAILNYNVMGVAKASLEACVRYLSTDLGRSKGIRVNAISAGPVNTLAARGVGGFTRILKIHAKTSALGRNNTVEEIGDAGMFYCSHLSRGITGEVTYVDCGFSIVGLGPMEAYNLD